MATDKEFSSYSQFKEGGFFFLFSGKLILWHCSIIDSFSTQLVKKFSILEPLGGSLNITNN